MHTDRHTHKCRQTYTGTFLSCYAETIKLYGQILSVSEKFAGTWGHRMNGWDSVNGNGRANGCRERRKGQSVFKLLFLPPQQQVIKMPLKYFIGKKETSRVKPFFWGSELIQLGDLYSASCCVYNVKSQLCEYLAQVCGLVRTGPFLLLSRQYFKAKHYHFRQTGPGQTWGHAEQPLHNNTLWHVRQKQLTTMKRW